MANLQCANLSRTSLRWSNFVAAHLEDANLSHTNLWDVRFGVPNLGWADLIGTDLSGAQLEGVDLSHVNLSRARLRGANLSSVDLSHANLDETDFTEAVIAMTAFGDRDLRVVKGLETVHHNAPSPLSINTIYRSEGLIPEPFLRGTGAPDSFLEYFRSLTSHPIHYHSCFISYAHQDDMLARRLHADLQDHGVRCWFAPEDMKVGDKIRTRIDEAIHLQDKLLLLLSEHALASPWVEDEVEAAFEKERQQQRDVLFPVRLDDQVMHTTESWATKLRRTRHIGDFTNWTNPRAYEQAFERLLRHLKAEKK